jgi:hypothetical protein
VIGSHGLLSQRVGKDGKEPGRKMIHLSKSDPLEKLPNGDRPYYTTAKQANELKSEFTLL